MSKLIVERTSLTSDDIFNACLNCIYENNTEEFSSLLDAYPDSKSTIVVYGLIHYLYDFGWTEGIQIYIEKGGKLDVLTKDYYGRFHKVPMCICGGQTFLHVVAARSRHDPNGLHRLIESFPELNIKDWNGNLPEDILTELRGFDSTAIAYRKHQNDLIAHRIVIDISGYDTVPIEWVEGELLEPFVKEAKVEGKEEGSCGCSSFSPKTLCEGDVRTFLISEDLRVELLKQTEDLPVRPPNSMHRYGKVILPAMESTVKKLVKSLLDVDSAGKIFHLHAFYLKYDLSVQTKLALHMDDSTYTINICLSNDSTGAELVFDELSSCYRHSPRRGIVHRGFLKHHVEPLQAGVRENIIIWVTLI
jgi:hypothetical protein